MRLTSYGGAGGQVTGSCHLLETKDHRVLIDCGFFQGRGGDDANRAALPFDPAQVDFLVLTHAHLDHTGRIPLLVQRGFQGQIVSTAATYDLARLILLDSAEIQVEDARRKAKRKAQRAGRELREPLYDVEDVLDALDLFDTFPRYDQKVELGEGLSLTFRDAGHILGSAFAELEVREGRRKMRRITFSGDLGNLDKPLIRDPQLPSEADLVVMESTYGDRNHRAFDDSVDEFRKALQDALERGGNVIIPSFALERSQELLYILYEFYRAGDLPKCKIFLDSPLAIDSTKVYTKHGDCFDEDALKLAQEGGNPFHFDALEYVRHNEDSREINEMHGGAIIIAGAGMCTGGRVLHHLRHNLWRTQSSVIFVGFASEGTLGREIIEGRPSVSIFGEDIPVRAKIHTINGFSGHAGQKTLLDWLDATGEPEKILLVHGEDRARTALSRQINEGMGLSAHLQAMNEGVDL
jgi:metallo-beta-lactamase family protein